jgi:hypothetical protein
LSYAIPMVPIWKRKWGRLPNVDGQPDPLAPKLFKMTPQASKATNLKTNIMLDSIDVASPK